MDIISIISIQKMASETKFELCPKTFTFFYDYVNKKYYILEGYYEAFPFWHDDYDEEKLFNFDYIGAVEIHKNKTIKVIRKIDGGYSDDLNDYFITRFADIDTENENGLTSKIPVLLRQMFEWHPLYRDTPKGTLYTEEDFAEKKGDGFCDEYYDEYYNYTGLE